MSTLRSAETCFQNADSGAQLEERAFVKKGTAVELGRSPGPQ